MFAAADILGARVMEDKMTDGILEAALMFAVLAVPPAQVLLAAIAMLVAAL